MESEPERSHHEAAAVQVQLQRKIQLRNHPAESKQTEQSAGGQSKRNLTLPVHPFI